MDHDEPIALEYATRQSLAPPPEWLWRTTTWLVKGTGAVGLLILFLFAITRFEMVALIGLLWLYVGALATFVAFIPGVIYAAMARSRGFPFPATERRATWAVLLPILNVLLAIFCVISGIALLSLFNPHTFGAD